MGQASKRTTDAKRRYAPSQKKVTGDKAPHLLTSYPECLGDKSVLQQPTRTKKDMKFHSDNTLAECHLGDKSALTWLEEVTPGNNKSALKWLEEDTEAECLGDKSALTWLEEDTQYYSDTSAESSVSLENYGGIMPQVHRYGRFLTIPPPEPQRFVPRVHDYGGFVSVKPTMNSHAYTPMEYPALLISEPLKIDENKMASLERGGLGLTMPPGLDVDPHDELVANVRSTHTREKSKWVRL
jgi:hypothetical protein